MNEQVSSLNALIGETKSGLTESLKEAVTKTDKKLEQCAEKAAADLKAIKEELENRLGGEVAKLIE